MILTIIGARPQFIKAAAVSKAFFEYGIGEKILHTGQHYDDNMSDIFFKELGLPNPAYNLNIGSSTHGQQTAEMLKNIEIILLSSRPDYVMVYGDTNSTLAGTLAAVKLHIPVVHVESGLRSFNRKMPEEINRIITDHSSDILFAPTEKAMSNLTKEGLGDRRLYLVGDVMFDMSKIVEKLDSSVMESLGLRKKEYVICTIHRAENTDDLDKFLNIFKALNDFGKKIKIIFPAHPRTYKCIEKYNVNCDHIIMINPLGYVDMAHLIKNSSLVITDSGGVQKEAFFYNVPCVTLRDETEWVELIDSGWNVLCPVDNIEVMLHTFNESMGKNGNKINLYGNGDASYKIAEVLK